MFFRRKNKNNILGNKRYRVTRQVRYKNPTRLKNGIFKFKLFKIINILLVIAIFVILYFFIFSNYYNINNVEVIGNKIIATDDILDITNDYLAKSELYILRRNNIFVFSKKDLSKKINEVIIYENLKVEKILPNTIRITIQEKEAALKWLTNDQTYLVDTQGTIIKRFYKLKTPKIFQLTKQDEINNVDSDDQFTKITNFSNNSVNLGDKVLNQENVQFIFNLLSALKKLDYVSVKDILVESNFPQYLTIETNKGFKIHFNFNDSIDKQIDRLDLLVKEKIKKENLGGIDYIDLKLGESIYFKYK